MKFLTLLLSCIILSFALHAQTGTANGNYNFASISTTSNSHSTGFKTQQDKLAVNNGASTYPLATPYSGYQNSMYDAANTTSNSTGSITIKAEGGSVCKTFTLKNIDFYIYNSSNQSRSLTTMTMTIKNYSGTTIATHTFSGTYNTTNAQTLFSLTNIPFSLSFPSTGYTGVSEINFTYTCGNGASGYSPSNLFFRSITLEDISASLSPTITSFTPSSAKPSDVVTITGTNFNTTAANNVVFFGATQATVTAATATQLTVTVPKGATYGPISELNSGAQLSCNSLGNFNPIYSPAKTNITTSDFSAAVSFAAGRNPIASAIGDFDGDGKTDLLVANFNVAVGETLNKISVYLNTSVPGSITSSSFTVQDSLITNRQPYNIAVGDLDGDGKLDLAIPNQGSNLVSIYRNTSTLGNISFAAKVDIVTAVQPRYATVGDIDGDGQLDIIVTNAGSNTVSVFLNNSTIGSLNFASKVDFATGTAPIGVSCNDIDGNGKLDLIVANYTSNTLSVLRNTSTSGSISFAAKVDFTAGSSPNYLSVADVDNDGKLDIALGYSSGVGASNIVSIFKNNSTSGSISLATKVDFAVGAVAYGVSFSDLDGDSKPDLVASAPLGGKISIFRNIATTGNITSTSFSSNVDISGISQPGYFSIGDLDGDGRPDLVVPNNSGTIVSIFRNTGSLSTPTISATGTLNGFSACSGTASTAQSFTVGGSNLTNDVTVTAPTGYEVSTTSGSGYSSSITLTQSGGTVAITTIYARLAGTATGSPSGNIAVASTGATTQNIAVSGTVNPLPTITLGGVVNIQTTSTSFSLPYTATTGSPVSYGINTTTPNTMSGFTSVSSSALVSSPISVAIPASAAGTYNFNLRVVNAASCFSSFVPFTVTVVAPASPSISVNGALSSFTTCSSIVSAAQNFTVSGNNLTNNIVVSAPTGYEVSTASASGYGSSVTLTQTGGSVATTTIYARLTSTATGSPSGNITVASAGATTQNIAVSGTVNALPSITLGTVSNVLTTATSFSLPYTATTGSPNLFAVVPGSPNALSGFSVFSGSLSTSPLIVTIPASAADTYNFSIRVGNSACLSSFVPFTVTVVTPASPSISVNGTLSSFTACSGTASAAQSFTVGGNNLTNNIVVTAPTGYEVSLSSGNGYASSVTLTQSGGSVSTTTIYARLTSTAAGTPSGNITVASTGATTQNIAVSGTVNALPNTSIAIAETSGVTNNDGIICNGSSVTLTVAGLDGSSTVLWSTGAITNSITVSPASTTTYTAIVTNANGCTKTSSVTITVNALPSASVSVVETSGSTGNDGIICSGATVQLIASGIDASSSFFWSTGQLTNTISYSLTSTQTFTLTVTNNTSGCVLSVPKIITVNSTPTITLGAVSSVLPTATSFSLPYTATTASPTFYGIVAASPNVMSGFSSVGSAALVSSPISVAIPASAPGTYNFNLRVVNAASCFSSLVPFTVTVGSSATVTATGTLNGFSTCLGTASTAQSFTVGGTDLTSDVTVTAPTGYEVSTTQGSGYSSSLTLTQSSGSVATTTIYTRLSSTATGSPSGNITVASTGATTQNIAVSGTVNALPNTRITVVESSGTTNNDGIICNGASVTLTVVGLDGSSTVLWSTGAITNSITVSPVSTTTYTAIVTNANGCTKTSSVTITVNSLPNTSIAITETSGITNNDGIICNGSSVQLSAIGLDVSSSVGWSTGVITNAITVSPVFTTSYSLYATNANGCTKTSSVTLTVNPLPTASISAGGATTFCQGGSVTLTASAGTSYLWSTGATTASINVSTGGNYSVTVTNASGCSATSAATTVTVNPLPPASISAGGATTFCQGGSVTLTASAGTSYLWSTGATTASINVSTGGNYSVTVTNTSGCSATSAATTVTVNPLPTASISAVSTVICGAGNTTNLIATGGATYQWFRNGIAISGATASTYAAANIGTYTATATSAFGCTAPASGSLVVTQLFAPKANFSYDSYCTNKAINFTNTSTVNTTGGVSYIWSDNNANTSSATNARFTYPNAGNYSVKLKVQSNTCSNLADSITVVVPVEAPRAAIRQSTLDVAINDNVQLQARNFGNQYAWSPSVGLSDPFISNPIINTSKEQEYLITIGVLSGCTTVDTLKVRIHESNKIYVPNVFTPNGDGQNDKLYLIPVGISELKSYRIFNRWGKKLFETSSISQGWDGTFNGQLQPLDTYVWTVLAVDKNGNTIHQEGTVTLLR